MSCNAMKVNVLARCAKGLRKKNGSAIRARQGHFW